MLSICMIVKNEEQNITKYLECTNFAHEVIVVDTGSTDDTVNILKGKDVILKEIKWEESFSKARNYAHSFATKEWILWLDADDFIRDPEPFLKIARQKPEKTLYSAKIINGSSVFHQARIYPNHKVLQWERRVHEQINTSALKNGYQLKNSECEIIHNGYNDLKTKVEKAKRNIALIKKDIIEGINFPQIYMELGDCYFICGDRYNALLHYHKICTPENEKNFSQLISFAYYKIGHDSLVSGLHKDAKRFFEYSCKIHKRPDSLLGLAIVDKENAKIYLEEILKHPWDKERYEYPLSIIDKAKRALKMM